ncbi:unnamed protein product [Prunus armeniaca]|uniref:RNase H type-1 domain-containing protein n=1 Tax=Prunus armeniaca TaxID=36596 RepID=A0A6J5UNW9_PRUAR|nr:unnamed protein product [Prunus armeniaca]
MAYDRVEWCYIENAAFVICTGMGTTMDCLSTVSFSVLWHGNSFGHFSSQRGLHQGCPLSPCLFLFCAEGFSGWLRFAERNGSLIGVCAPITHLLYAYDNSLFLEQTPDAWALLRLEASHQRKFFCGAGVSWKINVDGAVNLLFGFRGLGVVIRDSMGDLMLVAYKGLHGTFSPKATELYEAILGLQIASQMGHPYVILEIDAKEIIMNLQTYEQSGSMEGALVD